MATVTVDKELDVLVEQLGRLRDGTPVDDPGYEDVRTLYRQASDLLEQAIEKGIDAADQDYQEFSRGVKTAILAIDEALKKIRKLASIIALVAQVLDITGKVVAKLVTI